VTEPDRWVRVGAVSEWTRGRGRRVEVGGAPVAVFWDGRAWTAVDDTCPHMGASLADGRLLGDEIQCSWHEWRYDRTTGTCPVRPWARVRVWPVRIEGGAVWLEPPPEEPPRDAPASPDDPEWLRWDPKRYFKGGGSGS